MARLSSIIRKILSIDPSAPALEYEGKWHSWGELSAIIDAVEEVLEANGIGPGARIGGILRNTPQIAAVIIGTVINNRCVVTLNPMLPSDKLVNDICSLKTPVIIAQTIDWERPEVLEAARGTGALCLEVTGDPTRPVRIVFAKTGQGFDIDAAGVGIEMLTSGTTGTP
ncbi:MAG: AMP-binding protein, partial [Sphingomonas sp.]